MQAIISINSQPKFVIPVTQDTTGYDIYFDITSRYGWSPDCFYITDKLQNTRVVCSPDYKPFAGEFYKIDKYGDSHKECYLDISMRLKGGGIMKRIFKSIFKAIFAVFKPIIKPLQAIANAFLLLIKAIIYMIALVIWFFKLMAWFFVQFLPSLPLDVILLIKQLTQLTIGTIIETISQILKRIVNFVGQQTIYSVAGGWDNARNSTQTTENDAGTPDGACKQHCYRAPDGSIPFSLVVVTVLCPPVGVFMEYGMLGWFKILVCLVLTLMMYFPGLIYALILLYC